MLLKVVLHPNPILREKSREIERDELLGVDFEALIKDMKQTMLKKSGIGLAGPQIGKNIRLIIVNMESGPKAFINPKITKKSWRKNTMEEGCLSVPNIYEKVKRPAKINLEYLNTKGEKHKAKLSGLMARVFQHEIDHLDGILFIDKK